MTDIVAEGIAAWSRLKGRERKDWADWMAVAAALLIGRAHAMKLAKSNKCMGSRYNAAMGAWLRENGLDGINNQERHRAILCVEHREAIEQWRATLDDAKRRRFNHPNCVWYAWRRATRPAQAPAKDAPLRQAVQSGGKYDKITKIHWPQGAIKAAADAMRESRSTDWYKLARLALESAVPDAVTLLQLLPEPPKTITRPAKPMKTSSTSLVLAM